MRRHHVIFFLHTDNLMGNFRHGAQREFLTRKMLNISPLVGLFAWCSPSTPQNAKDIPRWIVYDVYTNRYGIYLWESSKSPICCTMIFVMPAKPCPAPSMPQAEYWIRLGMMSELYPELNHQQIKLLMLKSGSDRLLEVINAINNH